MPDLSTETSSPGETEALAARLGAALTGGMLLTLSGELGAGKTVFVRGLARGLSCGGAVTSPSYVLQHIYRGGRLTLYHIDAYRLRGGADEFEASGLHEALADAQGIVCVEWPERVGGLAWPAERLEIVLEHLDPQRRRVTLTAFSPRGQEALRALRA